MRREGYDIERLMDSAGLNTPAAPLAENEPAASIESAEAHP
jgi:hypothetical protein